MSIHRFRYADAAEAAAACARNVLTQLATATAGGGTATLAVSGGTSPAMMFREMARQPFDWSRVHLFWVDERAVPPTDEKSNYRLALENFITPAHFPHRNVHRVQTEFAPDQAAARYAEDIRDFFGIESGDIPHFDVIHRGIGPDAHTASLFPGEPLIEDREGIAAAVWVEKMSSWRITLLPAVLLSAHNTVILATGKDKAEAVRQVFEEPYEPLKYPSQLGFHDGRGVTWFMDSGAATLVE
ncbi:MAG: 6-phosphogluconolactonase [Acidobacteria bacterium]|nr:6-phosphogluconolactonase [Acidobacteriota bacterium]